ncbi:MAG: 30S ribosomal protein S2 [Candidatus Omnitrophica bacterium]|nr:30S ribosomal protein S2 [Candidatus Omnitrophota bacterium]
MEDQLIKQLLEAGVHFGHRISRWNPKMEKFIFGQRYGIYILDLEKTKQYLGKACDFVIDLVAKGKSVIFVGTKKQIRDLIEAEAKRCSMHYVTKRWIGGLLTNFSTVKRSIERLREIEEMKKSGFANLSKKDISFLEKERVDLARKFSGLLQMEELPGALFVIDTNQESTAIKEARRLSIPIVALIDTNSNPEFIDYPVPGNDDAIKSVALIASLIADAVIEGRKRFVEDLSHESLSLEAEKEPEELFLQEETANREANPFDKSGVSTERSRSASTERSRSASTERSRSANPEGEKDKVVEKDKP